MAISTLTTTFKAGVTWSASVNLTGTDYSPLTQAGNINKTYALGTASANSASGGGDEFISYIISLAASANTTVDLTNVTNIVQQSGVSFARIKGYMIRLLSTSDDSTNGTNCTSITVGAAASNMQNLELGGNTNTFTLGNGGCHQHFDPSAAGFSTVGASTKNIKFLNNDATNAAAIQLTVAGATT